jgi:hypothetical protein
MWHSLRNCGVALTIVAIAIVTIDSQYSMAAQPQYRMEVKQNADLIVGEYGTDSGRTTYGNNFSSEKNNSLEMVLNEDGSELFFLGDARDGIYEGAAQEWHKIGVSGSNLVTEFEMDLKLANLYLFMQVNNIPFFLDANNPDVADLKQLIAPIVSSADAIRAMEVIVKINSDDAKGGKISKAILTVDATKIIDKDVYARVNKYLSKNFEGIKNDQIDVILGVDPENNYEVSVKGIALKFNKQEIQKVVEGLREHGDRNNKLISAINELEGFSDSPGYVYSSVVVIVNSTGEYSMMVRMKSKELMKSRALMSRLGIEKGSADYDRLFRRENSSFYIDVDAGNYSLDLALKCSSFM